MRTTVRLPDGLHRRAKQHAAATGTTFTQLLEEGLRLVLDRATTSQERAPYVVDPLPECGGMQPGVDLNDSAALMDRMERE